MFRPALYREDLFDNFFNDFARPVKAANCRSIRRPAPMKTDIKESDAGFDLDIELPGYSKEDVNAQLKDGVLVISASTHSENEEKDENGRYIRRERYSGSSSRSFYVGDEVTEDDIKAKFENGILKIFVPKKEVPKAVEEEHYIAIEG